MKTADQILAIPLGSPERLFTGDADVAKAEHRLLRGKWHPDVNPGNDAVMSHINALYDEAVEKLKAGTWKAHGLLTVVDRRGGKYQARYLVSRPFELGEVFIGERIVAHMIRPEFADLAENALRMISNFRFAGDEMRAEVLRYLPTVIGRLELPDGGLLVTLGKSPEHLCLRDLVAKLGGKFEPRHAAWVMSRLHNLTCYFQWAGLVHNEISMDSYYVSPAQHTGCLVGGWWYAARRHDRIPALPERTMRLARTDVLAKKIAAFRTDGDLIRAVGREILGDPVGTRLTLDGVPAPMADWLRSPGSGDAMKDFEAWDKVLGKAFGPRRFVRMEAPSGLYESL